MDPFLKAGGLMKGAPQHPTFILFTIEYLFINAIEYLCDNAIENQDPEQWARV